MLVQSLFYNFLYIIRLQFVFFNTTQGQILPTDLRRLHLEWTPLLSFFVHLWLDRSSNRFSSVTLSGPFFTLGTSRFSSLRRFHVGHFVDGWVW